MSRRRRHMETSEVALMAVMTKAMGAFLILMVFGLQYYFPDFTAAEVAAIIQRSVSQTKADLAKIDEATRKGGPVDARQIQDDIAQAMKRLDDAAQDIEQLRVRLDQANAQLRRSEDERTRLTAENTDITAELQRQRASVAALQAQLASVTAERDKMAAELKSLDQSRQDLANAAKTLKRGDVTKAELDAIQKQVDEALKRVAAAEADAADLRAQLERAQAEISKLQGENDVLNAKNNDLVAERDKLQTVNDQLNNENGRLKDEMATMDTRSVSFEVLYPANCGDAELGLIVSRLPPDPQSSNAIIQPDGANRWTAIIRGGGSKLFDKSGARPFRYINSGPDDDKSMRFERWNLFDVVDGEKFAFEVMHINALPLGSTMCHFSIIVDTRNAPPTTPIYFDLNEALYNRYGPTVMELKSGAVTRVAISDDENSWLDNFFTSSPCLAILCDPYGDEFKNDVHDLLTKRYLQALIGTTGIDEEEKAASKTTLDVMIQRFRDKHLDIPTFARMVAALKTDAIVPRDKPLPAGQHLPTPWESYVLALRMGLSGWHETFDRFKARANKGWWTFEDAKARLDAAGLKSNVELLDRQLDEASVPHEPGGPVVRLLDPLVEKGIIDPLSGMVWADRLNGRSDPPEPLDEAALARLVDRMRQRQFGDAFITTIEAMARAKKISVAELSGVLDSNAKAAGIAP